MGFRWIDWNLDHIAEHGIDREDAELVVERAKRPYPIKQGDQKWMVHGHGRGGRFLQVIYVTDPDGTVFVVHARPLTEREKKHYRRRIRR